MKQWSSVYLIALFGLFLVAVSCALLIAPRATMKKLGMAASTMAINLFEAFSLILFGIAFVLFAHGTRFPLTITVFGYVLLIEGVGICLVPRAWHRKYAVWSVGLVNPYVRFLAPLSLAFGALLIYSVL